MEHSQNFFTAVGQEQKFKAERRIKKPLFWSGGEKAAKILCQNFWDEPNRKENEFVHCAERALL